VNEQTEEAKVTHCLYRRNTKNRPDMAKWVERKLLKKSVYDFDRGWFFVLTRESPVEGEVAFMEWMRENFHKGYIHILMRNPGSWLRIPAGKREKRTRRDKNTRLFHDNESVAAATTTVMYGGQSYVQLTAVGNHWPVQKFHQGVTASCVVTSMASALYYMGLSRTAAMLQDQAAKSVKRQTNKERIELVETILRKHEPTLFGQPPTRFGPGKFRVLEDVSNCPTLLILESVDGDSHHAVTLVGHWIFDAAETKALPICLEALNRCAKPGFERVFFAIRFNR
jgi:hypothetical protein